MENSGSPRVFVFLDIAGFSALTEAHGDAAAANLIGEFGRLLRDLSAPGGRIIKLMGDGALAVFDQAVPAVAFGDAVIRETEGMPGRPGMKIGMHYGSAIENDGDYVGHAVNLAARVAGQAESCQILSTASVRELFPEEDKSAWRSIGRRRLKNIADPVELFLFAREECKFFLDPVCRMRLTESEGISYSAGAATYRFCSMACADLFRARREAPAPRPLS